MALKSNPVTLGITDTTIYQAPVDAGAVVQPYVSNIHATLTRTYTLRIYKASTSITTTLGAPSAPLAALAPLAKIPLAVSLEPGDRLIGLASAASSIVVTPFIDISRSSVAKGFNPRGVYSAGTTYAENDVVYLASTGASYISIQDANTGNSPDASPAYWMVSAAQGVPGTAGVAGASSLQIVRVMATGAATPTTDFETGDTVDGMTLATNDLVLRNSASSPELNGVYVASASGAASRHSEYDAFDEHPGRVFSVMEGTTYADTLWQCTSNAGGVLGTNPLTFENILRTTNAPAATVGIKNGMIVESRASNATTFALKTLAGADPSASDPVYAIFSNGTQRIITAALSLTASSGSTLGASNVVPFRVWILLIDDAATMRLGAIQCCSSVGVLGPPSNGIVASSTAEGGAGGADTAQIVYTDAAVTAKQFLYAAFADYDSGLTTAGTWNAAPTRIQQFGPHISPPGSIVQTRISAGGSEVTTTSTTDQLTNMNGNIALRSAMNRVLIHVAGTQRQVSSTGICRSRIARGSTMISNPVLTWVGTGSAIDNRTPVSHIYLDAPNTTVTTTYNIYVSSDVSGQTVGYGTSTPYMTLQEIMG